MCGEPIRHIATSEDDLAREDWKIPIQIAPDTFEACRHRWTQGFASARGAEDFECGMTMVAVTA